MSFCRMKVLIHYRDASGKSDEKGRSQDTAVNKMVRKEELSLDFENTGSGCFWYTFKGMKQEHICPIWAT